MPKKRCTKCKELRPFAEFFKNKCKKDGLRFHCKSCDKARVNAYGKTREGLVRSIYYHQRSSSKSRDHLMPEYGFKEFSEWVYGQVNFDTLYLNWINSGFDTMKSPSVDRRDDYKPYTIDNLLRVCTWQENFDRHHEDRKKGVNNKSSKSVIQLTKNGEFIREFYSIRQAERETGVFNTNISHCCSGKVKTAGGFKWGYAEAEK